MIKSSILSAAIASALLVSGSIQAQSGQNTAAQEGKPLPQQAMQHPYFAPPMPPKRIPMPKFPTAQELEKMAPPEPLTEEKIKERFAKRKARINETLERDRKAAEKYAQDYARLQKHQADSLAELMARAEKRREAILKRIDEMEQRVLQRFQEKNAAKSSAPSAAK